MKGYTFVSLVSKGYLDSIVFIVHAAVYTLNVANITLCTLGRLVVLSTSHNTTAIGNLHVQWHTHWLLKISLDFNVHKCTLSVYNIRIVRMYELIVDMKW